LNYRYCTRIVQPSREWDIAQPIEAVGIYRSIWH